MFALGLINVLALILDIDIAICGPFKWALVCLMLFWLLTITEALFLSLYSTQLFMWSWNYSFIKIAAQCLHWKAMLLFTIFLYFLRVLMSSSSCDYLLCIEIFYCDRLTLICWSSWFLRTRPWLSVVLSLSDSDFMSFFCWSSYSVYRVRA